MDNPQGYAFKQPPQFQQQWKKEEHQTQTNPDHPISQVKLPSCYECSPKHGQPPEQVSVCQPAKFRKFSVQVFPLYMNDGWCGILDHERCLTITVWKPAAFPEAMFRVLSSKNIWKIDYWHVKFPVRHSFLLERVLFHISQTRILTVFLGSTFAIRITASMASMEGLQRIGDMGLNPSDSFRSTKLGDVSSGNSVLFRNSLRPLQGFSVSKQITKSKQPCKPSLRRASSAWALSEFVNTCSNQM